MKTDLMLAAGMFLLAFAQFMTALWMRSQMKINDHTKSLFEVIGRRFDLLERKK